MVHARYAKSSKHKKLKSVDPANKTRSQPISNARKSKKKLAKEKARIQRLSEQHVPKKMVALMDCEDLEPTKRKRSKRGQSLLKVTTHMNEGDDTGATRPLKTIPETLQQGPYESQTSFLKRLDKLCNKVRSETKIEAKYNLGDKVEKDETKTSNKILRRRERDKKRKSKKKRNRNLDEDKDFPETDSNIFLPV